MSFRPSASVTNTWRKNALHWKNRKSGMTPGKSVRRHRRTTSAPGRKPALCRKRYLHPAKASTNLRRFPGALPECICPSHRPRNAGKGKRTISAASLSWQRIYAFFTDSKHSGKQNIRPGSAEKYLAVYAPGGIIWSTICGGGWRTHNPAAPKTDRRDYALYTQYYGKNI